MMLDLIKKIVREYAEPQLIIRIDLQKNLLESKRYLGKLDNQYNSDIILYNNQHSELGAGGKSSFSRVDTDRIIESINEYSDYIIDLAIKIIKNCKGNCSIVVVDYSMGFDYHMWVDQNKRGQIILTINTSIGHNRHLFNTQKSPTIVIDRFGNVKYSNLGSIIENYLIKKIKPLL